jgi:hypothetical protein
MIGKTIRYILINNPAVSGLVGNRVYPLKLPLDCVFPAISYTRVSNPYKQFVGAPRIQISCWGEEFFDCMDLENAVMDALEGYSGIVNGVTIERIVPEGTQEFFDSDSGIFHIPLDFKVIYRR